MEPLISVIVPVYNMAALLPRCVDSILAQTCNDIEIILVDDGSTDGTGALCTRYAQEHNNITAIHQENRGVSAARNAGIVVAKGRYLGFVDSDDWIEPEMYSVLLETLTGQDARIAACGYTIDRYDGALFREMVDPATPPYIELEQALKSLIHPRGIMGFLCNKLFARELLRQAGGGAPLLLDENIHICEDLLFVSRCIEIAGGLAYDNRPLYIYCVRDTGRPEDYDRIRRFSELTALAALVESWSAISEPLGAYMKRKYTTDSCYILRAAASAGDREYIPVLRKHLKLYLKAFLRSSEDSLYEKARILATLVAPRFEAKIKKALRGR